MDVIFIEEFRIDTLVGVYEWERKVPQTIQFDIQIGIPSPDAAKSDELDDTIDYGALCDLVELVVTTDQPLLLERLCERIAGVVLSADDRITAVELVVRKLRPPVSQQLATSGVRIRRTR